ncbi:MAG: ferritin-like domain-containing protein [Limisphaerales bacterium]
MNHDKWVAHFQRNREQRAEPDWAAPFALSEAVLKHLRPSLAEYQLGDGGGPACLIAGDAEQFRGSSEAMRQIVDLWFAEEREHSRLLGRAVDRIGARRIHGHWSFTAFLACRRAMGVRAELQVLLLVEIVSTVYYRLIRRHCADQPLREMCSLILRDEAGHVAFHRDRLAAAGVSARGLSGTLWEVQFRLFGLAAAGMLWLTHGRCLRALGARPLEFCREIHRELSRFIWRLGRTAQVGTRAAVPAAQLVGQAV